MSTETSTSPVPSQADISADGDVILVVGPLCKRLRVQSAVLRIASTYFKNMFGPHFAEGQDLNEKNPKEILMPDDSAAALEIVCNVIHHRNDAVPSQLKPQEVFEVAVAADKFDCVLALLYAWRLWLNPKGVEDIIDLGYLMTASYVLNNAQAFSEITHAMVLRHKGSYLPLVEEVVGLKDFVPWETLYLLEERRSSLRMEVQHMLFFGPRDAGWIEFDGCTCAWSSRHHLAYTNLLGRERLQPLDMLGSTVSQFIERLDYLKDPVPPQPWTPCTSRHETADYRSSRNTRLQKIVERNGLCLDCIRSTAEGVQLACRLKH